MDLIVGLLALEAYVNQFASVLEDSLATLDLVTIVVPIRFSNIFGRGIPKYQLYWASWNDNNVDLAEVSDFGSS